MSDQLGFKAMTDPQV